MTFDLTITSINYVVITDNENIRNRFNNHSNNDDNRDLSSMSFIQFKYDRRRFNLLKAEAFSIYKFYKKILNNYRVETYTQKMINII